MRSLGCNTISFYIPWNFHEPAIGKYLWDGEADIATFLSLAAELA